ncbi:MAG: cytochrome ubiquinol oxidase subunit I [Cyanobacteria bacterium SZAS LIN-2]|nr:cytochrome ubiquinol oxidase subunit I [Cyanobacteria bacterium SZAS LIN-2]
MNYPLWVVPYLGGSWVIGIISIIHIFISHFAVGGGIFLAFAEQLAYRRQDDRIYDFLKQHSRFFVLLTTVAGATTGVGIWFSVSLVSPDGLASLIQSFTLAWAEEYLFFVAELATAFAYYYTWDKISREKHLQLARLYAIFSVFTLVIINGILTFMLTPGKWITSHWWFDGVFNPTYFPSLAIRLLIMLAIAGMYALVTCTRIKEPKFRVFMVRYCAKWLLPVFLLGPICTIWFLTQIPQTTLSTILVGIQNSGVGNYSIMARALYTSLVLSGTILLFAYFGPYLNPKGFTFRIALLFMVCGLAATGTTEWMREMLRKPYVVYNYIYSNGIHKTDIPEISQEGFLQRGKWASALTSATPTDQVHNGEIVFRYQCMACHTENGYRSMKKLLGERDEDAISSFLGMIKDTDPKKNNYTNIMPPLAASDAEMKCLAKYLATINAEAAAANKAVTHKPTSGQEISQKISEPVSNN